MEFRGHKATVVVELEMRNGAVLRVPVGDLASYHEHSPSLGELRLPIGKPLMERLYMGEKAAKLGFDV
jgi:hypothetical protein